MFAPGSIGAYQDCNGGDSHQWLSPPFSIGGQRWRPLADLSCTLAWTIDIIASSKRTSHSSLSRGSKSWILNRSMIDPRLSRALSSFRTMSFIDVLLKPIPLVGGVRFIGRRTTGSPTNLRSKISRFQRFERLEGTSRPESINTCLLMGAIFLLMGAIFSDAPCLNGRNLSKKPRTCPKTRYKSGVVRQSPSSSL